LPTRNARNGQVFSSQGRLNVKHARFKLDPGPLDETCPCYTCRHFSRAYLRHLYLSDELLGHRLLTLHNLAYYLGLMQRLRAAVIAGPDALAALRAEAVLASQPPGAFN
jgi:queuine tRNA-ribosyltransferase